MEKHQLRGLAGEWAAGRIVITSYSIHYTKLYDPLRAGKAFVAQSAAAGNRRPHGVHPFLHRQVGGGKIFAAAKGREVLPEMFRGVHPHAEGGHLGMAQAEAGVELDGGKRLTQRADLFGRVPQHAAFFVGRDDENTQVLFPRPLHRGQVALKKIIVVQVDEAEQVGLDRLEDDVERRVGGKADMAYEPSYNFV